MVWNLWLALIGIGICLMTFYAASMFRIVRRSSSADDENTLSLFSGWAGGVTFVAGGLAMMFPDYWLIVVSGAIVVMLAWFAFRSLLFTGQ